MNWEAAEASLEVNRSVGEVDWILPGTEHGLKELCHFIQKRLKNYSEERNDPNIDGLSNLSPWLHFGNHLIFKISRSTFFIRFLEPTVNFIVFFLVH